MTFEQMVQAIFGPEAEMSGEHSHKCIRCCTTWSHANSMQWDATPNEFRQAHTCPNCGETHRDNRLKWEPEYERANPDVWSGCAQLTRTPGSNWL